MFRAVLISTYDLGRQPFGLASPAAWLQRAGVAVRCIDLAVEALDEGAIRDAGLVAFHVPMHTATRLAARIAPRVRALNPHAHLCFYGLYAPMNASHLRTLGADSVIGGEFEARLTALAVRLAAGAPPPVDEGPEATFERLAFVVPDRSGLPSLDHYARLRIGAESRLVGATEASRGCRHLCRHCPIVPVYGGRFRIVPAEVVLADIRAQVAAGASHMTFGDPDFFNGPGHALPIVHALHREFPDLTYDVTIKIEHLLRHADRLAELRDTGCLFVTSAVEAVDDRVLEFLDKGHSRADFVAVAGAFRSLGMGLHPTFVAFTPWIALAGYLDLLATLEALELIDHVAPVQLAIRLLIPAGSRLLDLPAIAALVGAFDAEALVHPWRHPDPAVDALQRDIELMVRDATARGESHRAMFDRAWALAERAGGRAARTRRASAAAPPRTPVPYLTEPWYC